MQRRLRGVQAYLACYVQGVGIGTFSFVPAEERGGRSASGLDLL